MVPIPILLLVFVSSNYPREAVDDRIAVRPTTLPGSKDTEKKLVVDQTRFPSQANDLTAPDVKFPEEPARTKIIREKVLKDEKEVKGQTAVPLYSLVKNECREGYALDENGVCQKIIAVRSGKTFDSEKKRRRRRFAPKIFQNIKSPIFSGFEEARGECGELYPGMVPDGTGGCKKLVRP